MKTPFWKKLLILVLIAVYSSTQVVLGALAESNFWKERQKKSLPQFASLPLSSSPLLNELPSVEKTLSYIPKWSDSSRNKFLKISTNLKNILDSISRTYGTIQDIYEAPETKSPPVVLIQDIHMNSEAQSNIAKLLQGLIDHKKVGLVGVEGAFGPFDFAPFRAFSEKNIVKEVADDFLSKKLLAAPSYVGITSTVEPPSFVGVDDRVHYDANVQAYRTTRNIKEKTLNQIGILKRELNETKKKVFSAELRKFDDLRSAHAREEMGLGEYVKRISVIPADAGIQSSAHLLTKSKYLDPGFRRDDAVIQDGSFIIEQFLAAYEMESSLDFNRLDQERKTALENLAGKLNQKELSELLNQSLAYKMGQLGFGGYYEYLKDLCQKKGIDLRKTPAFENYIRYVILSDGIKADKLFDSVDALEKIIVESLAQTQSEKSLMEKSESLNLAEKLVEFLLTPKEWQRYKEIQNKNLNLSAFERFYEEAQIRSQKMVGNLLLDADKEVSVLITGGFHTPDIAEILRTQKISYVIISPKVTKVDDKSGSAYLSAFAREKTPLDKLFAGEKLFLALENQNVADRSFFVRILDAIRERISPSKLPRLLRGYVLKRILNSLNETFIKPILEFPQTVPAVFNEELARAFVNRHPKQFQELRWKGMQSILVGTKVGFVSGFVFGLFKILSAYNLFGHVDSSIFLASMMWLLLLTLAGNYFPHAIHNSLYPHARLSLPAGTSWKYKAWYEALLNSDNTIEQRIAIEEINNAIFDYPNLYEYFSGKLESIFQTSENQTVRAQVIHLMYWHNPERSKIQTRVDQILQEATESTEVLNKLVLAWWWELFQQGKFVSTDEQNQILENLISSREDMAAMVMQLFCDAVHINKKLNRDNFPQDNLLLEKIKNYSQSKDPSLRFYSSNYLEVINRPFGQVDPHYALSKKLVHVVSHLNPFLASEIEDELMQQIKKADSPRDFIESAYQSGNSIVTLAIDYSDSTDLLGNFFEDLLHVIDESKVKFLALPISSKYQDKNLDEVWHEHDFEDGLERLFDLGAQHEKVDAFLKEVQSKDVKFIFYEPSDPTEPENIARVKGARMIEKASRGGRLLVLGDEFLLHRSDTFNLGPSIELNQVGSILASESGLRVKFILELAGKSSVNKIKTPSKTLSSLMREHGKIKWGMNIQETPLENSQVFEDDKQPLGKLFDGIICRVTGDGGSGGGSRSVESPPAGGKRVKIPVQKIAEANVPAGMTGWFLKFMNWRYDGKLTQEEAALEAHHEEWVYSGVFWVYYLILFILDAAGIPLLPIWYSVSTLTFFAIDNIIFGLNHPEDLTWNEGRTKLDSIPTTLTERLTTFAWLGIKFRWLFLLPIAVPFFSEGMSHGMVYLITLLFLVIATGIAFIGHYKNNHFGKGPMAMTGGGEEEIFDQDNARKGLFGEGVDQWLAAHEGNGRKDDMITVAGEIAGRKEFWVGLNEKKDFGLWLIQYCVKNNINLETKSLMRFLSILREHADERQKRLVPSIDLPISTFIQLRVGLLHPGVKRFFISEEFGESTVEDKLDLLLRKLEELRIEVDSENMKHLHTGLPAELAPGISKKIIQSVNLPRSTYRQVRAAVNDPRVQKFLQGEEFKKLDPEDRLGELVSLWDKYEIKVDSENMGQVYSALPAELAPGIAKEMIHRVDLPFSTYRQVRAAVNDPRVQEFFQGAEFKKLDPEDRLGELVSLWDKYGIKVDSQNMKHIYSALPAELVPGILKKVIQRVALQRSIFRQVRTAVNDPRVQEFLKGEEFKELDPEDRLGELVALWDKYGIKVDSENMGQVYSALPAELALGIAKKMVRRVDLPFSTYRQVRAAVNDPRVQEFLIGEEFKKLDPGDRLGELVALWDKYGIQVDSENMGQIYRALPAKLAPGIPKKSVKEVNLPRSTYRQVRAAVNDPRVQEFLKGEEFKKLDPEDRLGELVSLWDKYGIQVDSENMGQVYKALPAVLALGVAKKMIQIVDLPRSIYRQVRAAVNDPRVQEFLQGAEFRNLDPEDRLGELISLWDKFEIKVDSENMGQIYRALPAKLAPGISKKMIHVVALLKSTYRELRKFLELDEVMAHISPVLAISKINSSIAKKILELAKKMNHDLGSASPSSIQTGLPKRLKIKEKSSDSVKPAGMTGLFWKFMNWRYDGKLTREEAALEAHHEEWVYSGVFWVYYLILFILDAAGVPLSSIWYSVSTLIFFAIDNIIFGLNHPEFLTWNEGRTKLDPRPTTLKERLTTFTWMGMKFRLLFLLPIAVPFFSEGMSHGMLYLITLVFLVIATGFAFIGHYRNNHFGKGPMAMTNAEEPEPNFQESLMNSNSLFHRVKELEKLELSPENLRKHFDLLEQALAKLSNPGRGLSSEQKHNLREAINQLEILLAKNCYWQAQFYRTAAFSHEDENQSDEYEKLLCKALRFHKAVDLNSFDEGFFQQGFVYYEELADFYFDFYKHLIIKMGMETYACGFLGRARHCFRVAVNYRKRFLSETKALHVADDEVLNRLFKKIGRDSYRIRNITDEKFDLLVAKYRIWYGRYRNHKNIQRMISKLYSEKNGSNTPALGLGNSVKEFANPLNAVSAFAVFFVSQYLINNGGGDEKVKIVAFSPSHTFYSDSSESNEDSTAFDFLIELREGNKLEYESGKYYEPGLYLVEVKYRQSNTLPTIWNSRGHQARKHADVQREFNTVVKKILRVYTGPFMPNNFQARTYKDFPGQEIWLNFNIDDPSLTNDSSPNLNPPPIENLEAASPLLGDLLKPYQAKLIEKQKSSAVAMTGLFWSFINFWNPNLTKEEAAKLAHHEDWIYSGAFWVYYLLLPKILDLMSWDKTWYLPVALTLIFFVFVNVIFGLNHPEYLTWNKNGTKLNSRPTTAFERWIVFPWNGIKFRFGFLLPLLFPDMNIYWLLSGASVYAFDSHRTENKFSLKPQAVDLARFIIGLSKNNFGFAINGLLEKAGVGIGDPSKHEQMSSTWSELIQDEKFQVLLGHALREEGFIWNQTNEALLLEVLQSIGFKSTELNVMRSFSTHDKAVVLFDGEVGKVKFVFGLLRAGLNMEYTLLVPRAAEKHYQEMTKALPGVKFIVKTFEPEQLIGEGKTVSARQIEQLFGLQLAQTILIVPQSITVNNDGMPIKPDILFFEALLPPLTHLDEQKLFAILRAIKTAA